MKNNINLNGTLKILREHIYPILIKYYEEGETYSNSEICAKNKWDEIVGLLLKESEVKEFKDDEYREMLADNGLEYVVERSRKMHHINETICKICSNKNEKDQNKKEE